MKVIMVSGKYRSNSEWEFIENIRKAEQAAIKLWREGWAVFCPHKNTAHFGGLCDDSVWLEGDIEILKRCDAIYFLKNWSESDGAIEELRIAREIGLEIYFEL